MPTMPDNGWMPEQAISSSPPGYFTAAGIHMTRLKQLSGIIGKSRLVLDLSCRKRGHAYLVATDRWQTFTDEAVTYALMDRLSEYCDEFLIHAVDVEGRCAGIETDLVAYLGGWEGLPVTYAGGISNQQDIDLIASIGNGKYRFYRGQCPGYLRWHRACLSGAGPAIWPE
jgi:phosphoribosylformimino-5-aminoimidazole carboxamide ribotide isomerase